MSEEPTDLPDITDGLDDATGDKSKYRQYDLITKAQAITMRLSGEKWQEIELKTGITRRACYRFLAEAKKRGFDPDNNVPLKTEHLKEKPRPGRPRKFSPETEARLLAEVEGASDKTTAEVAAARQVSKRTIQRTFKRNNTKFSIHRGDDLTPKKSKKALAAEAREAAILSQQHQQQHQHQHQHQSVEKPPIIPPQPMPSPYQHGQQLAPTHYNPQVYGSPYQQPFNGFVEQQAYQR